MRQGNAAAFAALAFLSCLSATARVPVVDGDADGVDDSADRCLYSPPGVPVDAAGCSPESDEDGDGAADTVDACPYSPPAARVDAQGCALDSDFDGIADGLDVCPNTELGAAVDPRGCQSAQAAAARTSPIAPAPLPAAPVVPAAPAVEAALTSPAPSLRRVVPAPVAPQPKPAIVAEPEPLLSLRFTRAGAQLGDKNVQRLQASLPALRAALASDPRAVLLVRGYAEASQDSPAPETLARTRANKVRRLLAEAGIDAGRLRSVGLPPVAQDGRRVEVVLEKE